MNSPLSSLLHTLLIGVLIGFFIGWLVFAADTYEATAVRRTMSGFMHWAGSRLQSSSTPALERDMDEEP